MITEVIKLNPEDPDESKIVRAVDILKSGGLIAFPTETVYGLAVSILNEEAVERLYAVKKRNKDKPFVMLVSDKDDIEEFTHQNLPCAYKIIDKFWPGPLTVVLKSKDNATIALRMSSNKIANILVSKLGSPIYAPSANISGSKPAFTVEEAMKDLDGLIDLAIDGGRAELCIESTIVDLTLAEPKILRIGAIMPERILKACQRKIILLVCAGNSCRSVIAQHLLQKMLKHRDDVEVVSAGLNAFTGMNPAYETIELLKKEGIDASNYQAKALTNGMIKKSDIILVMERSQESNVLSRAPQVKNRVYLLKEFAKIQDNGLDIPDPIGRTMSEYQECFNTIKNAVERIAELI